jgi:hypothetical protein
MNTSNATTPYLEDPGSPQPLTVTSPAIEKIRLHGRVQRLASVPIDDRLVITTGRFLRVASIYDEDLLEESSAPDLDVFLARLKDSRLDADLFTFAQHLPDTTRRYPYAHSLEALAVIPVSTLTAWLQTNSGARKAIRRAERMGVTVTEVDLDDALLDGVLRIYNESPIRQGKRFWHYQEDRASVKAALSTYRDRSTFLGAYCDNELIGFLQFTRVDATATILQILSSQPHFDKRPNNALIGKAIEVCETRGLSYLVYGKYGGYDPTSSLTEFKRRNGFQPISLPRYYIPLTVKGYIALLLGLNRSFAATIPTFMMRALLRVRAAWYQRRYGRGQAVHNS